MVLCRPPLPPPTDAHVGATAPDRTPIVMVDERELLRTAGVDRVESWWYPYSLQMVLKLLASLLVVRPNLSTIKTPTNLNHTQNNTKLRPKTILYVEEGGRELLDFQ